MEFSHTFRTGCRLFTTIKILVVLLLTDLKLFTKFIKKKIFKKFLFKKYKNYTINQVYLKRKQVSFKQIFVIYLNSIAFS